MGSRRRVAILAAALSVFASAPPVVAQDAQPLWLLWTTLEVGPDDRLIGRDTLLRLDPATGDATGRIEYERDGCTFERLVQAPDGAVWLVDRGWPGVYGPPGMPSNEPIVAAERHCIGYLAPGGAELQMIELEARGDRLWDVGQTAAFDGKLWFAGSDSVRPPAPPTFDLFSVDPAAGSVTKVRDDVSGVASAAGSLYLVDTSRERRDAAAVLGPDGTEVTAIDVPLREPRRRRDARTLEIHGGDDAVYVLERGQSITRFDPATGESATMRARQTDGSLGMTLATSADGIWIVDGPEGFGGSIQHAPFADSLDPTDVGGYAFLVRASPDGLWFVRGTEGSLEMPNGQTIATNELVRVDPTSLEATALADVPIALEDMPPLIEAGG